jgi:hypothetical protein
MTSTRSEVSIWKELRERRVLRVGLVYLAVGWALIEGAETLSRVLDLPEFTARLVLALVGAEPSVTPQVEAVRTP